MFPTGVGMNRETHRGDDEMSYVPHGRGDEPQIPFVLVALD
jgi:hypothetical protein